MNILRIFCNLRSCGYDHRPAVITENSDIAMMRRNFATLDLRCNEGLQVRLIGVAGGGGQGAMPPQCILDKNKDLGGTDAKVGQGGSGLPIDMLGPQSKSLLF